MSRTENENSRGRFSFVFLCVFFIASALIAAATGVYCTIKYADLETHTAVYNEKLNTVSSYGGYRAMLDSLGTAEDEAEGLEQEKEEKTAAFLAAENSAQLAQARYDAMSDKVGRPDSVNTHAELEELRSKYSLLSQETAELSILYMSAVASAPSDGEGKIAYLTFDDGVSSNTLRILDILDSYGIKATFFPNWHSGRDELYKAIVDRGHAIGNHTSTHEWSSVYATPESFAQEVTSLSEHIYEITGVYPKIFRFPGGSNNTKYRSNAAEEWKDTDEVKYRLIKEDIKWLYQNGYMYFDWNIDSTDASGHGIPAQDIIDSVLNSASSKNRIIVLMHDTASKDTTVEALPSIIEGLKAQGFTFGVLTDQTASVQFIKYQQ